MHIWHTCCNSVCFVLNGAVGGRGKGWFIMDLSVKASFGNSDHQMSQVPTARCCQVQEKYTAEVTMLYVQREHLQSPSVCSYSGITQPSCCNANMSNCWWHFQAIHSPPCTTFTILKLPMSLDLHQALNNEAKAVSSERSEITAAILQTSL